MGRLLALVFVVAVGWAQAPLKFMGRVVTITKPKLDASGFNPMGPATICVELTPRQCYTMPEDFGRDPEATVVQINKDISGLFFSARTGGVSGGQIHFAVLRPGKEGKMEDLFLDDPSVSVQNEYVWWTDPTISDSKIFGTADFVWGPGECHVCEHRYIISVYVLRSQRPVLDEDNWAYALEDRYMTAKKYRGDDKILESEKPEILARLKRAKHSRH